MSVFTRGKQKSDPYRHPSGGWGSIKEVTDILSQENVLTAKGIKVLLKQNKAEGFACVSCSWAKSGKPHVAEFCESGVKATAWEITTKRADAAFFAQHTVTELESWSDHELEGTGRLTEPMKWDAASDRYLPIPWNQAFAEIGAALRKLAPKSVVCYASGRASLETSYMWQLFARMYGNNNLPDSSNMCHETTSVALPQSIGVPIGTIRLEDFEHTDCIFFFGQNVGTNSPRMLHPLQEARQRGCEIITFNPIREPGLVSFANPQSPLEMLTPKDTTISTQYHQPRVGGDSAVIMGICKTVIAADDAALRDGDTRVLDIEFIEQHTQGLDAFKQAARATEWDLIERESGLKREAIEQAAAVYMKAKAVIVLYGMGLTQHRKGVRNIQMLCNMLFLRGNIGRPGAGVSPVRGHSNVQGQRTVGITEKPELAPLDKLAELFHFEPPREKGLTTVEACEGVLDGSVKAFLALGGNFTRAVPDTDRVEAAWRSLPLMVQIATKPNRSHLIHGELAYLLPCLGRIEIDRQSSGEQAVSMEDSTGVMHGSRGQVEPAADTLLSEAAIVAGIAKATLDPNPHVDWDGWVANYSKVRDMMEKTFPENYKDINTRMWLPDGFPRPNAARERKWKTKTGKAMFATPDSFEANPDMPETEPGKNLQLFTIRSDGQFNTTVYTMDDRFRGVYGTRKVLLMNPRDIAHWGLNDGEVVKASTISHDGVTRSVDGLTIRSFNVPDGCVAGYYPECNPLIPLWHHDDQAKTPASKSIPISLERQDTVAA
ncbi:MAG: FdhF/YdeP family oxidoreductase [Janthinobacterium lividum]